jgi:hypothetical protein
MSSLRKHVDELVGNGGMGAGGWRSGRKWDTAGSEVRGEIIGRCCVI